MLAALAVPEAHAIHVAALDPAFGGGRVLLRDVNPGSRHALVRRAGGGYALASVDWRGATATPWIVAVDIRGSETWRAPAEVPDANAIPRALAEAPDGGLVVAARAELEIGHPGPLHDYAHSKQIAIVRVLPDGRRDTHFGTDGTAVVALPGGSVEAGAMSIAADGNIAVAGSAHDGETSAVARLDWKGRPDTEFNHGLLWTGDLQPGPEAVSGVVAEPDGALTLVGVHARGAFVARLTADGSTLDRDFAQGGLLTIPGSPMDTAPTSVLRAPGGGVLVLGRFDGLAGVIRLGSNGLPDPAFGEGGLVTLRTPPGLQLRSVIGTSAPGGGAALAAAAFDPLARRVDLLLARIDEAGRSPTVSTRVGFPAARIRVLTPVGIVTETDGRMVVAGDAIDTDEHRHTALLRLLLPTVDPAPAAKRRCKGKRAARRCKRRATRK